jgi:uncharacterized protein
MPTLRGHAIVVDTWSEDLGFRERITRQAVERALARKPDALALVDHDPGKVLGRISAGTLRLQQDSRGLRADIDVADTTVGRDTIVSVGRRDVRGMSFAFTVPEGGDRWDVSGDELVRTVDDLVLWEVTVTSQPAYLATSIEVLESGARSAPAQTGVPTEINLARLRLSALLWREP